MNTGIVFMLEPWMQWAFGEAVVRTLSGTLTKVIGMRMETFAETFFSLLIIGAVQTLGGLIIARRYATPIFVSPALLWWSILFGFNGFIASALIFFAFARGGDLGVVAFVSALSIIPGAFLDRIFFRHRLRTMQWLGICVGIGGMYVILDYPNLAQVRHLPSWMVASLGVMFLLAINQAATQASKEIDASVKNIWSGAMTFLLAVIALTVEGWRVTIPWQFFVGGFTLGLFSIVLVIVNVMSYKTGAHIAAQKMVVRGSLVVLSMMLGFLFFGEPLGWNKLMGVVLYMIALMFMGSGRSTSV